jgi:lipid-A-disaccharide synthase
MKVTLPPPTEVKALHPVRPDVLIVAGEHSGDEHGAQMVRELRALQPDRIVCALGGPQLAAAGAQLLWDLTSSSVVGIVEVLRNLSFFRALHAEILRWITEYRPRVVCFIDYPGLNLRLAEALRGLGLSEAGGGPIRTVYYISPQIWAWKGDRRFTMARDLNAMAVIFPFEIESYADTILPVEFVGHPFVAREASLPVRYDPAGPVLLLPGSRTQAVRRIFPALLAGHRAFGERPAVVLYPSERIRRELESLLPSDAKNVSLQQVGGARPPGALVGLEPSSEISESVFGEPAPPPIAASAVLTSSGTMSMQCALAGVPGAIAYRANPLTYLMGRLLVQVPYLGIANLLVRRPMYPEYIQGAATPEALAAELRTCVHDVRRQERTQAAAADLRALLSVPASGTAGEWLARQVERAQRAR